MFAWIHPTMYFHGFLPLLFDKKATKTLAWMNLWDACTLPPLHVSHCTGDQSTNVLNCISQLINETVEETFPRNGSFKYKIVSMCFLIVCVWGPGKAS